MRFQVPQFIEVEDKIFGPLTIKQFIYLAGGAGMAFIIYSLIPLPKFINIVIAIPFLAFSVALAFYKINNKPFIFVVEAAVKYFFSNKLYIWKKSDNVKSEKATDNPKEVEGLASIMVPKIADSKLKDLTWSLDIKESIYNDKKQK